jgi:pimeloyl-ACP methyl ester carboxylesterase
VSRRRVVFVHGALVRDGAWWWHRTAEVLAAQGISSVAPLLPSCGETGQTPGKDGPGFIDDVVSVRAELAAADEPLVVVAHSYGGCVVSEAADGLAQVERLVFVSSVLPLPGESLSSFAEGPPPPWIDLRLDEGTFALRSEYAREHYLQDCPDDVLAPAIERLVPQTLAVSATPVKSAAWQAITSTYVVCADDRGSLADWQRARAERADEVVELEAGHHPFLSMPEAMAELVMSR